MSISASQIIQQVQQLCLRKKLRFTAVRREVLELLLQAQVPCKAYTLLERMAAHNTQPTAVYRALDFLLQHGFAHKIHSQNSYIACHHPQHNHDCYFLICRHCGSAQECCDTATEQVIVQTVRKNRFKKPQAFVEIFADCSKCAHN